MALELEAADLGWDPARATAELREQLASSRRRLGLFLGAGTSMALGFPGIEQLTRDVQGTLEGLAQTHYNTFLDQGARNVEDVLSRVRLCRELIGESSLQPIDGLDANAAKTLDTAICNAIHDRVSGSPPGGDAPTRVLAHWLAQTYRQREHPVEVFTTNYDLVFERAMETAGVPFFDGFVGSVAPFFAPESVDPSGLSELREVSPPRAWTRLWKLHGSIGWRLIPAEPADRISRGGHLDDGAGELMIFPSREKYAESRRLPFITLQDRLRHFLASGEVLLLVLGYSFSDEHLNEILLQGLRSNSRLSAVALMYSATRSSIATYLCLVRTQRVTAALPESGSWPANRRPTPRTGTPTKIGSHSVTSQRSPRGSNAFYSGTRLLPPPIRRSLTRRRVIREGRSHVPGSSARSFGLDRTRRDLARDSLG